ncbi:MAG: beta strand repeat-containing protein [Minisyncoccota bacterium]
MWSRYRSFLSAAVFVLGLLFVTPSAVQAAIYAPGATLDPACAPTDASCGVSNAVGSGTTGQVPYYASAGPSLTATSTLTILSSGNVGFGTTSPYRTLSVAGSGVFTGGDVLASTITATSSVTAPTINATTALQINGTSINTVGALSNVAYLNQAQPFTALNQFNAGASTTQLTTTGQTYLATAGGNVGIGTTSPYRTLSVAGSGVFTGGDVLASTITATSSITAASLSLTSALPITSGGTGTSTGGVTNGVEYYNGTTLTNNANLTFNGTTLTTANDASIHGVTVGLGGGSVSSNTAVGNLAFTSNTTGTDNTANGYQSLYTTTTGTSSSAFGSYSLYNNNGSNNTALGFSSLYTNTSGHENIASAPYALYSNTTGYNNAAYGFQSLYMTTTGHDNVANGYQALYSNTVGSQNTALGSQALFSSAPTAISYHNTAIGYQSLYSNVSSGFNTAVGYQSLYSNVGTSNSAFGDKALYSNTGSFNSAFARSALQANTTGSYNTASGMYALFGNTTGTSSTAVGYSAGQSNTTGYNNTFLGQNAGYTDGTVTTPGTLFNATAIGYNAQVTANNSLILGGTGTYRVNVGIGTTSPAAPLTIWGPDTATTSALTVANSASTTVFSVYDNGNATYSGSIFQSSDHRLKTAITPLEASSSLAAILNLNPVSYTRIDQPGQGTNLGFIAQDVQQIFPELVSTTSPTALTPDGTLTLNYVGLISPIVEAIKGLASQVSAMAQSITTVVLNATTIHTQNLCIGSTCVTESQLKALLSAQSSNSGAGNGKITITDVPVSTCTLTASSSKVTLGDHTVLSWSAPNADTFSIDQDIGSVSPAISGTTTSKAINADTTTFKGRGVTSSGAVLTCSTTVTVAAVTNSGGVSAENATTTVATSTPVSQVATSTPSTATSSESSLSPVVEATSTATSNQSTSTGSSATPKL